MKKKALAMLMAICTMAAGMSVNVSAETGDTDKLVVALRITGTTPADVSEVQDKMNEILRDKIGAEVELLIIPSGSYKQQMTLMLSGDEKLDVMGCNSGIYTTALASEALKPLDDLLAEYGQGIVDAEGEAQLEQGQVDGVQYGIPVMCDTAVGYGTFGMRTDILEKYNIDVSDVHSYDDMTEVFKIVHENEPDMTVIAPTTVGYFPRQNGVEGNKQGDYFGVLEVNGKKTTSPKEGRVGKE